MQDQLYIDDSIELANNEVIDQDIQQNNSERDQEVLWDYEENDLSNQQMQ